AGAGQEAEQHEAPYVPGEGRSDSGEEVDREGDEEELLAAEPVGQPAEEQRPQHSAGEIGAGGEADIRVAELEGGTFLERAGDGAGHRYLEAVEDPGDAEGDDDERVEAAPRQAVQPRGNVSLDRCLRRWRISVRRCGAQLLGARCKVLSAFTTIPPEPQRV